MTKATIDRWLGKFRRADMLMKIIVVNGCVWVALRLAVIVGLFMGVNLKSAVLGLVEMPSWLSSLATRPWTVFTYMFAQYDVLHIVFNMLWFYWFGYIFLNIQRGRRLLGLYLLGGLGGAALYLAAYNLLPGFQGVHGVLIGSSAAVIAIVTATAFMAPDFKMNLLFLGAVSLKWVAIVTIGLDILSVTGSNAGGHIAHIGGAIIGMAFALCLQRGIDITRPLAILFDSIASLPSRLRRLSLPSSRKRRPAKSASPKASTADRAELDLILDKIKRSGYSSLTPEERRRLFDVSNRIK